MALRPHGQAEVDPDHPRAFGKCDRCGDRCNLVNLRPQMQYAGPGLVNTGWLVCEVCLDEPNPGLRTVVIPPDPLAVLNPRFEPWDVEVDPGGGPVTPLPVVSVIFMLGGAPLASIPLAGKTL
jgi:hypothetical protein